MSGAGSKNGATGARAATATLPSGAHVPQVLADPLHAPIGATLWYIADKDKLDTDDSDYYRVRCNHDIDMLKPPESGWECAGDGAEPGPMVKGRLPPRRPSRRR